MLARNKIIKQLKLVVNDCKKVFFKKTEIMASIVFKNKVLSVLVYVELILKHAEFKTEKKIYYLLFLYLFVYILNFI